MNDIKKSGQEGASLVEYVLLIMLVILVAILSVRVFGGAVQNSFSSSVHQLGDAFDSVAPP